MQTINHYTTRAECVVQNACRPGNSVIGCLDIMSTQIQLWWDIQAICMGWPTVISIHGICCPTAYSYYSRAAIIFWRIHHVQGSSFLMCNFSVNKYCSGNVFKSHCLSGSFVHVSVYYFCIIWISQYLIGRQSDLSWYRKSHSQWCNDVVHRHIWRLKLDTA